VIGNFFFLNNIGGERANGVNYTFHYNVHQRMTITWVPRYTI